MAQRNQTLARPVTMDTTAIRVREQGIERRARFRAASEPLGLLIALVSF